MKSFQPSWNETALQANILTLFHTFDKFSCLELLVQFKKSVFNKSTSFLMTTKFTTGMNLFEKIIETAYRNPQIMNTNWLI